MLKARLFLRIGGHRQQQTDRIVNNFLRWFVTEPRTYIKKRGKRRQCCDFRKERQIVKEHIIRS